MDVLDVIERDPVVEAIASALAPLQGRAHARAVLVAGATGFGKSSVLRAASQVIGGRSGRRVIWVNGGVVASDGHLARLISEELIASVKLAGRHNGEHSSASLENVCSELSSLAGPVLLAIDDFDTLVFKRKVVAALLARMVASGPAVCLVATCRPSARDRLVASSHPLSVALHGRVSSVTLAPLDRGSALALIRRRAPRLSDGLAEAVIKAAGGHPAALVFLSRLTELQTSDVPELSQTDDAAALARFFDPAVEFAGAVYAEPWAALGPQQRAVLWQLGSIGVPTTAAEIARALELSASHVSAQLTRLVADGLVRRAEERGHFAIAPLLSQWIARRAARGSPSDTVNGRTAETTPVRGRDLDGGPPRPAARARRLAAKASRRRRSPRGSER